MNQKKEKEQKAVNRILCIVVIAFGCILLIIMLSFVKGTCDRYEEEIQDYELEIKNRYSFTNIERLDFLTTDEIITYKKLLQESLAAEGISENVNLTVLDTITHNEAEGAYEWLIVCDNQKNQMYANTYHELDHNFTVLQFDENIDTKEIDEEIKKEIKESASADDSEYVNGSIQNLAAVEPTVRNLGALSPYMDDQACSELSGKLLEFLVETNNNRRSFSVSTASAEEKGSIVFCVLHPEIELNENNTIKVSYDREDSLFNFEYTD